MIVAWQIIYYFAGVKQKSHNVSSNRSRIDLEFTGGQSVAYRKVASSNTSRLEAHKGIFRLLIYGIFLLKPFDKKLIS